MTLFKVMMIILDELPTAQEMFRCLISHLLYACKPLLMVFYVSRYKRDPLLAS